jgi:hypothetical protein
MDAKHEWIRRVRIFVYESHEAPTWRDGKTLVELMRKANADAIRFPATSDQVT